VHLDYIRSCRVQHRYKSSFDATSEWRKLYRIHESTFNYICLYLYGQMEYISRNINESSEANTCDGEVLIKRMRGSYRRNSSYIEIKWRKLLISSHSHTNDPTSWCISPTWLLLIFQKYNHRSIELFISYITQNCIVASSDDALWPLLMNTVVKTCAYFFITSIWSAFIDEQLFLSMIRVIAMPSCEKHHTVIIVLDVLDDV
jgi:hypothetical protein